MSDLDDLELAATRWLHGIEPEPGSEWYKIIHKGDKDKNGREKGDKRDINRNSLRSK